MQPRWVKLFARVIPHLSACLVNRQVYMMRPVGGGGIEAGREQHVLQQQ